MRIVHVAVQDLILRACHSCFADDDNPATILGWLFVKRHGAACDAFGPDDCGAAAFALSAHGSAPEKAATHSRQGNSCGGSSKQSSTVIEPTPLHLQSLRDCKNFSQRLNAGDSSAVIFIGFFRVEKVPSIRLSRSCVWCWFLQSQSARELAMSPLRVADQQALNFSASSPDHCRVHSDAASLVPVALSQMR